jgi:hypothetical protein
MTTMTDADIHAFGSGPAGVPPKRARSWHRWGLWLLLALLLTFVATVVGAVLVLGELAGQTLGNFDIRIDGERLLTLPGSEAAWWAIGAALLAALVVIIVVPLTLLLALVITGLALAAVVIVLLGVTAVALSPLWVVALVLWLALRQKKPAAQPV